MAVFERDTQATVARMRGGPCAEAAASLDAQFSAFEERMLATGNLNGSWSGFALRVDLAALKNKALRATELECP